MVHPPTSFDRRALLAASMSAFCASAIGRGSAAAQNNSPTLLISDPIFLRHDPGPSAVERASRMTAITQALSLSDFDGLRRSAVSPRADLDVAILRAHGAEHLEKLRKIAADPSALPNAIDRDTVMSSGTLAAATSAVAAGLDAIDTAFNPALGVKNVFCQVRPPGHHAEANRAMGFCFFSNIAIAAFHARAKHGAERVAVVDFDVHHGNGTQALFWPDKNLFFGSTHQMPLFPGTGAVGETGVGNICNAPLSAGDGADAFRAAMSTRILPALDAFKPDIILISAGFDAHEDDPIANLRLQVDDFVWVTEKLMQAADRHCNGRIVSMLEGGYNLRNLALATAAHVRTLMSA